MSAVSSGGSKVTASARTGFAAPVLTSSAVMPRGGAGGRPAVRRTGGGAGKIARMVLPVNAPERGVMTTALRAIANSPGASTLVRCA